MVGDYYTVTHIEYGVRFAGGHIVDEFESYDEAEYYAGRQRFLYNADTTIVLRAHATCTDDWTEA